MFCINKKTKFLLGKEAISSKSQCQNPNPEPSWVGGDLEPGAPPGQEAFPIILCIPMTEHHAWWVGDTQPLLLNEGMDE